MGCVGGALRFDSSGASLKFAPMASLHLWVLVESSWGAMLSSCSPSWGHLDATPGPSMLGEERVM